MAIWVGLILPDEGAGDDATTQEAVTPNTPPPPPANAVLALCRRIAARLRKPAASGNPVDESRKTLAGFAIPFSSPDDSGRWNYRWPGSRLTGDDMRKLNVLSNRIGLPCTELIHVAVGLLFAQTRDLILQLLATHEQTGRPFQEIAEEALATLADAPETSDQPHALAAEVGPVSQHPPPHRAPFHPRGGGDEAVSIEFLDNTPAIAAESPLAIAPACSNSFPSAPMTRRKSPASAATTPDENSVSLTEDVRALRDEVHVLRQAVDEFREVFEHTVQNLPDQLPPPLRIWSLPADPTAPDFGERINAVSPEQMEVLRAEAVQSAPRPPPATPATQRPAGLQRRLFS